MVVTRGRLAMAGLLAVALAVAGAVIVLGSPSPTGPGAAMGGSSSPRPSGSAPASPSGEPTASPTAASPSPAVLEDGTYPAYVRRVDVAAGTVTVDLIQTFEGREAVRAAMEDGLSRHDARAYLFAPVYVRNENPLLRTLPVSEDAIIRFADGCESSGDRTTVLRDLRRAITPFNESFYYSLSVDRGAVTRVEQHLAVVAC
ncbi:MAG TPA: hypothetical protein VNO17_04000 [Actinomycetota bacterium]|nr:hypothetical protein [Actinomycetota bacterium]